MSTYLSSCCLWSKLIPISNLKLKKNTHCTRQTMAMNQCYKALLNHHQIQLKWILGQNMRLRSRSLLFQLKMCQVIDMLVYWKFLLLFSWFLNRKDRTLLRSRTSSYRLDGSQSKTFLNQSFLRFYLEDLWFHLKQVWFSLEHIELDQPLNLQRHLLWVW